MSTTVETFVGAKERGDENVQRFFDGIMAVARPGAVFSPPVVSGNLTVITASQIAAGGGFGSGFGLGPAPRSAKEMVAEGDGSEPGGATSGGGGGGGGGGATGRPVAVIVIGPDGVKVKPVLDVTSIALAGITAATAMLGMSMRLRRAMRG